MSEAQTPDGSGQHTGEHQRPDPGSGQRTDPRAARRRANERAAQPGAAQPGRNRLGGLWSVFVVAAVVLLLLLVFILENSQDVQISYFGIAGTLPLGVALLLSAILGVLLVAVPGYARIIQLRRSARRGSGRG
ncbi:MULTISPECIES: lipopolysaccharide assembly protein LapA domain-containing protein [unclassified Crossiella]|uniref:lipopolysaccharide assembly protein LapA domain-containing protein n=1 Tax=unclassified Crossiella TaxID=2620835 RepID=UPI001FFF389B|nr:MULTISPECIES: LapA family protein [unclassified Crossiella]MCK2241143.1 LapA family protein [Crossiella sp. S99.2]MCK2253713.1 LapA family protein [Crossiella sp. S99.1]